MSIVENSQKILKARCDTMGTVLNLLFWAYAAYVAVLCCIGLWLLLAGESFTLQVLDTGNGLAGFAFYNGGLEVDFRRNVVNQNAVNNPKLVYLVGYLGALLQRGVLLVLLGCIRSVFRAIAQNATPFMGHCRKAVFRAGVCVLVGAVVCNGFTGVVLWLMHYGEGGNASMVSWQAVVVGSSLVCLSYVFEYGAALQTQADETL